MLRPIFLLKLGPSKQVWVSPEKLNKVYELPQCAGRPATFKDPFGDFLFLVRDPKAVVLGDGDGELIAWRFRVSVLISCHVKSFLRAPITTSWYPHPNWIVLGSKGIGFATKFETCPASFRAMTRTPNPCGRSKRHGWRRIWMLQRVLGLVCVNMCQNNGIITCIDLTGFQCSVLSSGVTCGYPLLYLQSTIDVKHAWETAFTLNLVNPVHVCTHRHG